MKYNIDNIEDLQQLVDLILYNGAGQLLSRNIGVTATVEVYDMLQLNRVLRSNAILVQPINNDAKITHYVHVTGLKIIFK